MNKYTNTFYEQQYIVKICMKAFSDSVTQKSKTVLAFKTVWNKICEKLKIDITLDIFFLQINLTNINLKYSLIKSHKQNVSTEISYS